MKPLSLAAVLVVALLLAADAAARSDGPAVPEPQVAAVIDAPCPAYSASEAMGCAYLAEATIYLAPRWARQRRDTLWHELGHLYDWQRLDAAERATFAAMVGKAGLPWWGTNAGAGVGAEVFANAYAACALGYRLLGRGINPRLRPDVCRFITAAW